MFKCLHSTGKHSSILIITSSLLMLHVLFAEDCILGGGSCGVFYVCVFVWGGVKGQGSM